MALESTFTKMRQMQFRGPTTSDDYNARIEENYKDLVILLNDSRILREQVRQGYGRVLKDQLNIFREIQNLQQRVYSLEAKLNQISFFSSAQVDVDRFASTSFAIDNVDRCGIDDMHGLVTLPKVDSSSFSKLSYTDAGHGSLLPSALEARVATVSSSADDGTGLVDTSDPVLAFLNKPGSVWERNVITSAPNYTDGAQCDLYIKIPAELFSNVNSNGLMLHPFPSLGVRIVGIYYTTAADVLMEETDNYVPLNTDSLYLGDAHAISHLPPGAFDGDDILDCGPILFYFDPKSITGLKLRIRQDRVLRENDKYIYSYGMSSIDLRYDKFLSSGKTMIRYDAPSGDTISSVTSVTPEIYNVDPVDLSSVFSYRIIWETSYESGVYTTVPVANSQRVWVEVSLNQTYKGGTPSLSRLTLNYQ